MNRTALRLLVMFKNIKYFVLSIVLFNGQFFARNVFILGITSGLRQLVMPLFVML